MEAVFAMPLLLLLIAFAFALGRGHLLGHRATIAARDAAWTAAALGEEEAPSSAEVEERIGAGTQVAYGSEPGGMGSVFGSLGITLPALEDRSATVEVEVDSPVPGLLPSGTLVRRFALMSGFWQTDPDEAGLEGFLGGVFDSFGSLGGPTP
jgi:hypothetical protein